jgi:hypothetical protein
MGIFSTIAEYAAGAMAATAANGYAAFEENGLDVVMPTVPGNPNEVNVTMLIDTHQLINGTHPDSVEIDPDGSVYYDV